MELLPNAEFFDRETADLYWDLQAYGTRVPVYSMDVFSMTTWCRESCEGKWAKSAYGVLIDFDVYMRSILIADGTIPNPRDTKDSNWIEAAISDSIARSQIREQRNQMAEELGIPITHYHFWFSSKDDAILFKLTWGGE